jgi:hypothetical protein
MLNLLSVNDGTITTVVPAAGADVAGGAWI